MREQIPIVVEHEAREEAYEIGYEAFADVRDDLSDEEAAQAAADHSLTDSAHGCNNVLPALRAIAGYADAGMGTYTRGRDVIVVDAADLDDRPIMGTETHSDYVFDELVDAYYTGVADAAHGAERAAPTEGTIA